MQSIMVLWRFTIALDPRGNYGSSHSKFLDLWPAVGYMWAGFDLPSRSLSFLAPPHHVARSTGALSFVSESQHSLQAKARTSGSTAED